MPPPTITRILTTQIILTIAIVTLTLTEKVIPINNNKNHSGYNNDNRHPVQNLITHKGTHAQPSRPSLNLLTQSNSTGSLPTGKQDYCSYCNAPIND
jgi:hypothetical protein